MKAIVNVNPQWGIGCNGELLCRFKEDMKRFKDVTYGKVIVYGRKTLESFPGKKPLPGRVNIVLSSSRKNIPESAKLGCDYYSSMKKYKGHNDIIITGITMNHVDEGVSTLDYPTSLVLANDINLVEDIGLFMGHHTDDIIVCGGEKIYREMLPLCDTVYVTKNLYTDKVPDTFFPNLDEDPEWSILDHEEVMKTSESGIPYEFLTYRRIQK